MLKIMKKIISNFSNFTFGSFSPIVPGNNNNLTFNNIVKDSTANHIELETKVKSKIEIFFVSFEEILIEYLNTNKSNNDTKSIKKLRDNFINLVDLVDSYKVSLIANNITEEIDKFYSLDIIKLIETAIVFNDFIEEYSINIPKISKEYFTGLLPDNTLLSSKYSETIKIYNNI
ncbi:MAG: hypothetical protein ACRC6U_03330 [Fusobacteriaceae bacterium]